MTTLQLPTVTLNVHAADANPVVAAAGVTSLAAAGVTSLAAAGVTSLAAAGVTSLAAASPQAHAFSVTIDVDEPACGPESIDTCASEMSFCDLAESVAPSDSASQVVSPRPICHSFSALHLALSPLDDAYSAWKQDCERTEAVAREHKKQEHLVQMLLQQHAEREASAAASNSEEAPDIGGNLGMQHLVQSVRNIERSVANLHLHFGTAFPPNRRQNDRRMSVLQQSALASDMQQAFHCNNNINAPNMNRQHATGGRGRGRRHAQTN